MGISTAIASVLGGGAFAEAAAPIIAGVGEGALGGGALSAITGGDIGKGALGGALTGGFIPVGGELLGGTLGTTAADALGGAAGGALGGVATGQKPLTGALEGAAGGALTGALSSSGTPSTTSAAPGAGASAAGSAAPTGITPDVGLPSQDLSSVGSAATGGANVGSGTVGTQSLPAGIGNNLTSEFAQAAGGAPTLSTSSLDRLAAGGGASGAGSVGGSVAAATPSSVSQFLSDRSLSNAGNIITSNPGAAISAAGLGLDVLKGSKTSGAEKNIQAEASQLGQQGNQLEGYLQSGSLPPGLQAGINQASESAKATIRSQYASRGMSGSSAEQQDLAAVDQRAQAQGAQMAMQLLNTGISETGMASQLYTQLLNQATARDQQLGSAISNFAQAAAGGGQAGRGGITINYPQG